MLISGDAFAAKPDGSDPTQPLNPCSAGCTDTDKPSDNKTSHEFWCKANPYDKQGQSVDVQFILVDSDQPNVAERTFDLANRVYLKPGALDALIENGYVVRRYGSLKSINDLDGRPGVSFGKNKPVVTPDKLAIVLQSNHRIDTLRNLDNAMVFSPELGQDVRQWVVDLCDLKKLGQYVGPRQLGSLDMDHLGTIKNNGKLYDLVMPKNGPQIG